MTTIADLRIPAEEFALAEFFEQHPDISVTVLRGTAFSKSVLSRHIWIDFDGPEKGEEALQADESVSTVELLTVLEDRCLYEVTWETAVGATLKILLEDAMLLRTTGSNGEWELRALFPDRNALSLAGDVLTEQDLTFDIDRIYQLSRPGIDESKLTEKQYEVLRMAVNRGYFEVPRKITMSELADELDISQQSLSERIRRASRNMSEIVLGEERDTTSDSSFE